MPFQGSPIQHGTTANTARPNRKLFIQDGADTITEVLMDDECLGLHLQHHKLIPTAKPIFSGSGNTTALNGANAV